MKMKNMLATLSAIAVSATCFAAMSFSASAADVVGIASVCGRMGTYEKWTQDGSAQIDGNGQFEATWDITGDGTGTIEFLVLEIKGSDPNNADLKNFTKDQYPDLTVTIDEITIDGNVYAYTANDAATNLSYYEGDGRARIYLQDTWNVNAGGSLGVNTTVTQQVKVKFTVGGLYNESGAPEETQAPTEAPTDAPADTTAAAGDSTTAAAGGTTAAATTAAAKATTAAATTNANTADTTGIALVLAGLTAAGAVALVSKKNK